LVPRGRAASTTLSLVDWRWPYPSELSIMLGQGVEIAVLARTLRARRGDAPPP
jgi:transposase